jgi:hypothetical protein
VNITSKRALTSTLPLSIIMNGQIYATGSTFDIIGTKLINNLANLI